MPKERLILTVVGKDRPGIVAGIAHMLYEHECDIQETNQTVLDDEFAMILLLQPAREADIPELDGRLKKACEALGVTHTLRAATGGPVSAPSPKGRVIVTVIGADRIGIVASVTRVLAGRNINIVDLSTEPYVIQGAPQYAMIARVEVDDAADMSELRSALGACAQDLSVNIDVQSQEIFDAMHKV